LYVCSVHTQGSDHLDEEKDKKLNYNKDQIHLSENSANKEVKNMHSATCEQGEQHISTLSSTTERRLLNLESQLNSLITSHLMKIYQTEHNHSTHHNNVLHSSSIQENNLKNGNTVVVHGKNEINSSKVKDTLDLCQYIPEKEMFDGEVQTEANVQSNNLTVQSTIDPDKSLSQPVQQLSAQSLKNPNLNTFQRHNHSSTMKKQSVVDKNPSSTSTKSKSISGRLSQRTSAEKKTRQEILGLGFVLLGTRRQGVPVMLRELMLSERLDLVTPSFTVREITTELSGP
uniref:Rho-GAP domain-containing protein n=1 Tax=Schistosoma curassoni TaxID=6186 RepID=A0A183JYX9_9TREM